MEKTKDYQIIQSRLHSWMKATFRTSKSNDTLTCTRCYCRCIKHQADKDVSNIKQRISLLLVCAICCSRWLPACADDLILHSLLLYLPFEPIRRTGCLRLEPLLLALPVACAASSGSALCSALHCWGCCAKTEGEGRAPHQDYLNLRKNRKSTKEKKNSATPNTARGDHINYKNRNWINRPEGKRRRRPPFPSICSTRSQRSIGKILTLGERWKKEKQNENRGGQKGRRELVVGYGWLPSSLSILSPLTL